MDMNIKSNANRLTLMLDTVSLKIKYPEFQVVKPELFYPELVIKQGKEIPSTFNYQKSFKKYVQNSTFEDRQEDIYKPRLTAYRRFEDGELNYYLHIEFSIPKILYGNNLQEIIDSENCFKSLIVLLQRKLATMGINASEKAIKNSIATKVHFGKNILLPYPMTVRDVLAELKKADLGRRMEVNTREYRNDGESLYFYTSSHNIIFYDKMKDIEKTRNISVDKDKTKSEYGLLQDKLRKTEQVLRLEIRFNSQKSVYSFVSKLLPNKPEVITFESIFSEVLWKKAILKTWTDITDKPANQLAFKIDISSEDVLNTLIQRERTGKRNAHTLNKTLINFGLYFLVNEFGVRRVKNKLNALWSDKSCGLRLDEKIRDSAILLKDIPYTRGIAVVEEKLQEFKRYDLG